MRRPGPPCSLLWQSCRRAGQDHLHRTRHAATVSIAAGVGMGAREVADFPQQRTNRPECHRTHPKRSVKPLRRRFANSQGRREDRRPSDQ